MDDEAAIRVRVIVAINVGEALLALNHVLKRFSDQLDRLLLAQSPAYDFARIAYEVRECVHLISHETLRLRARLGR